MEPPEVTGLLVMPGTADPAAVTALLTALSDLGFQVGEGVGGVVAVTGPEPAMQALADHVRVADEAHPPPEADQQVLGLVRQARAGFAWDEGSELHP